MPRPSSETASLNSSLNNWSETSIVVAPECLAAFKTASCTIRTDYVDPC
jgi:hypothetical protein